MGIPGLTEGDLGCLLTLLGRRFGFLTLPLLPTGIDSLVDQGPQFARRLSRAVEIPGLGIADPHLEGLAVDARAFSMASIALELIYEYF